MVSRGHMAQNGVLLAGPVLRVGGSRHIGDGVNAPGNEIEERIVPDALHVPELVGGIALAEHDAEAPALQGHDAAGDAAVKEAGLGILAGRMTDLARDNFPCAAVDMHRGVGKELRVVDADDRRAHEQIRTVLKRFGQDVEPPPAPFHEIVHGQVIARVEAGQGQFGRDAEVNIAGPAHSSGNLFHVPRDIAGHRVALKQSSFHGYLQENGGEAWRQRRRSPSG